MLCDDEAHLLLIVVLLDEVCQLGLSLLPDQVASGLPRISSLRNTSPFHVEMLDAADELARNYVLHLVAGMVGVCIPDVKGGALRPVRRSYRLWKRIFELLLRGLG